MFLREVNFALTWERQLNYKACCKLLEAYHIQGDDDVHPWMESEVDLIDGKSYIIPSKISLSWLSEMLPEGLVSEKWNKLFLRLIRCLV